MVMRRGAVSAVALLALGACTTAGRLVGGAAVPSVAPPGKPMTYVAIGASETVGIGASDPVRQGWAYVFDREALPRATVLYSLAISGATTEDALQREVPEAVRLRPDLVTVWLNVNDIIKGVPASAYGTELGEVLSKVRSARVLVANVPSLDAVPRFADFPGLSRIVGDYDRAIARAAAETGAQVVDLRPVARQALSSRTAGSLISADGLHPNAAGYALIARVFEQAYRNSPAR